MNEDGKKELKKFFEDCVAAERRKWGIWDYVRNTWFLIWNPWLCRIFISMCRNMHLWYGLKFDYYKSKETKMRAKIQKEKVRKHERGGSTILAIFLGAGLFLSFIAGMIGIGMFISGNDGVVPHILLGTMLGFGYMIVLLVAGLFFFDALYYRFGAL